MKRNRYSNDKDVAKMIGQLVKDDGWTFTHGHPHGKVISPGGSQVSVPFSPHGGVRALQNLRAEIRRIQQFEASEQTS